MDPVSKAQTADANSQQSKAERLKPHRWKKGESGNPSGRPKKKPITEIYEEILADPNAREAVKQQIIQTLTSKGMAGVLERREMAERTEGKVTQVVDMAVTGHVTLEQVLEAEEKIAGTE